MSARAELGGLEASGLIQIAALQPELEYLFRHALVQEAAYASLLKQDRRSLHLAAADAILALHPERERELAGVIAMHLEQAGDTERASQYLLLAGDHALERFANRESIAFYVRAGELAGESQAGPKLKSAIGAAKAGWGYSRAGIDIERLERAVAAAGDDHKSLVAEAYFWIAFLRRERGEVPESSPELARALARAEEISHSLGDATAAALPRALMGAFAAFTGNLRKGVREMSEALDLIETKGDPVSIAMIADFLAMSQARLGEFKAAEETLARAEGVAGHSDAISRVDVDITRSVLELERGDAAMARTRARECADRAEDLGAYACVVAASVTFGAASLARQDAPGAKAPLERGNELSLLTNTGALRTMIQGLLGSTLAQTGDMPGGIAGWNAALDGGRAMGDRFGEAHTLWGRGRTYARQRDWATALPDVDRAAGLFEEMEARPALARTLRDRALILRELGRGAEADADETRAAELSRELGLKDVS